MEQLQFRLKTSIRTTAVAQPVAISPVIAEPVLFGQVPLVGSVDAQYHGFAGSYSEGDLKLEFHCESAHSILSQQYYTFGIDAEVYFEVFYTEAGEEYTDYRGKIDFETISIEPGSVSASIVVGGMLEQLRNRWETPVAMDVTATLDNLAITPPVQQEIYLPGQTIRERGEFSKQGKFFETTGFEVGSLISPNLEVGSVYFHPPNMLPDPAKPTVIYPTGTVALESLAGINTQAGGVFDLGIIDPVALLIADTAGEYHVEIDWLLRINMVLTKFRLKIGKPKFKRLRFNMHLKITRPGQPDEIIPLVTELVRDGFVNSVEETLSCSYKADFSFPAGTGVFLFCRINSFASTQTKRIDVETTTANLRILIERKTRATPSRAGVFLLPDALRQVLGVVTSELTDSGVGRLAGSIIDGGNDADPFNAVGSELALTSGALLRTLKKAPVFTAKQLMETLWAQFAAGFLIEQTDSGPQVRVEPAHWFYRDTEILKLDTVLAYSETPDTEIIYNKIEVGYEKFPDEGPGVADEFNTTRTYQTPIISRDATLTITCPLIGAGTAIEIARRLGIAKTDAQGNVVPTKSDAGPYDDDGFLLHVKPETYTDIVTFQIDLPTPKRPYSPGFITFSGTTISRLMGGVLLKIGDIITITGTGTPNDGKALRIVSIDTGSGLFGVLRPRYEVVVQGPSQPVTPAGPVGCQWSFRGQGKQLRTNDRLEVQGIVDPETAYNIELTPARMLRRHAGEVNSGLDYKPLSSELRCMAYKHNGNLKTQLRPGQAPLPGDGDRQLLYDTGNVALGAFEKEEKFFQPELVAVTALMTRKQKRLIFGALTNKGDEDKRFGYISVLNPDGNYTEGYLRKITYNDDAETAEMTLRKRRIINPNAPDCNNYRTWSFGRFETDPTADKDLYRFCRFSSFQ